MALSKYNFVSVCECVCVVPHRDSTVSVDVFHCLNICIQLRVAVQISSTTSLQQKKPKHTHIYMYACMYAWMYILYV